MPPKKTPLAESDPNTASQSVWIAKERQSNGKIETKKGESLEDVAKKIAKTHGKKRSYEEIIKSDKVAIRSPNDLTPILDMDLPGPVGEAELAHVPAETIALRWDCNQIRSKINSLIRSGEYKVGEFQTEIDVSPTAYSRFLAQSGKDKGAESDTFSKAAIFFAEREQLGTKRPRPKKAKTSAQSDTGNAGASNKNDHKSSKDDDGNKSDNSTRNNSKNSKTKSTTDTNSNNTTTTTTTNPKTKPKPSKKDSDTTTTKLDVSDITLPNEPSHDVPIFDTCDDLRTKINAHLRQPQQTQAGLARTMSDISSKCVTSSSVRQFLSKKGPRAGANSAVYYAGYVYFEKLRVKQGKPKSKKRLEMEDRHPKTRCETSERAGQSRFLLIASERAVEDQFGIVTFQGGR